MFFAASKAVWFVLQPSSLMLIALTIGTVKLARGTTASGLRWTVSAMAAVIIAGVFPVADLLFASLEGRFGRANLDQAAITGIVVLGGAEDGRSTGNRELMALNEAAERLTEAAALARRFPNARIVFSGGSDAVLSHKEPEARFAGRLLEALGVDANRIALEEKSRNTSENALFTKSLVQPKAGERWILITSAWHMPRAIGCFRAAGFPVEPWPVDYRSAAQYDASSLYTTIPDGLRELDFAAKEYLGLIIYRLTGRTHELIPGPGGEN